MRSFLAIDFDNTLKQDLSDVQDRLKARCPKMTWVKPEQIHLTLKFFGEITDQDVIPISTSLAGIAADTTSFEVQIERVGVFPPAGRVNVVWVGITDSDKRLTRLQKRCEEVLAPLGFPAEDRRFTPHLTLARNKDPRQSREIRAAVALQGEPDFGPQRITELIFYQSIPGRGTHVHQPVSRYRLGAP